eukprot:gnl/TRDRNA2_/TRDRNA2_42494_c0_seq1.p1 gnl/TRDRNA2_/TRDRNA2_42494_c0~~gnl/TRDRNA2_/TRDRNA2_42494_c0_seq1.p1  ORF type:complete len:214 (+),score=22.71 gnl/TRDRNA2_/TRDRNA2_42494_c0_seq1:136-777(+)
MTGHCQGSFLAMMAAEEQGLGGQSLMPPDFSTNRSTWTGTLDMQAKEQYQREIKEQYQRRRPRSSTEGRRRQKPLTDVEKAFRHTGGRFSYRVPIAEEKRGMGTATMTRLQPSKSTSSIYHSTLRPVTADPVGVHNRFPTMGREMLTTKAQGQQGDHGDFMSIRFKQTVVPAQWVPNTGYVLEYYPEFYIDEKAYRLTRDEMVSTANGHIRYG